MGGRVYSEKEDETIIKMVQIDHQGFIINAAEISKQLGCSKSSVHSRIRLLRCENRLPFTYYDDILFPVRKSNSKQEDKFIKDVYLSGATYQEIADALGRSFRAVQLRISRLRKKEEFSYHREP